MKTKWILCSALALAAAALPALELQAAPGELDSLDLNIPTGNGFMPVTATAVQPDGKIIIGGNFTSVLGVPRTSVARLNADGTLDLGFNLGLSDVQGSVGVVAIALQPDRKVLLGGGGIRGGSALGRFNVDGMLDAGFDPRPNGAVYCIVVQPDGKVLIGGQFTTVQPNGAATATPRKYVARLNADGTLDTGFDPNPDNYVYSLAVQSSDGKVLLGGFFGTLQPNGAATPTTRHYIARVNADGTLDATFDPNPNFWVHCLAVQADRRIVFSGDFSSLQPAGAATATPRSTLARVNADGSLDSGFDPSPNGRAESIALLADGSMLLGGGFTYLQPNGGSAQPRAHIARIYADGTLDTAFNPNANNMVRSITVQANGAVLLGGEFTALQPNNANTATPRNYFARLQGYPASQTISMIVYPQVTPPPKYQLLWHRTGAGPELTRATFEFSQDDGATFGTPWGATRATGSADWNSGKPSNLGPGVYRARGYTGDGGHNGSSSLIQQLLHVGTDGRQPIPGLFNTGVDSAGTPLNNLAQDSHYVLLGNSTVTGTPLVATSAGGWPIPPWLDDNSTSAWITPNTTINSPPGEYYYQTTFDMTGLDLGNAVLTGRWATDNTGIEIWVDGFLVGASSAGFSAFTPFQYTGPFMPGLNTLTFRVDNAAGPTPNPTGLRVEISGVAAIELRITSFAVVNGLVTLTWISQPGHTYRVYSRTLNDPTWTAVPGDVLATSGVSSKTFPASAAGVGFYRVALLQ
jgi:uncharacterized delta-60 repeat protein